MEYEINSNLNLYLLKTVLVSFADGSSAKGCLTNISQECQNITIDDASYPICEITDIEMTGVITYHTYHIDSKNACEIAGAFFGLDDFVPETDYSKILYGEFDCNAACHLVFTDSKITARDVRILSFSHTVYAPALTKFRYMYLKNDGTVIIGTLQNADVFSIKTKNDVVVTISPEDVKDIIRLPQTNDIVKITCRDNSMVSGTVSVANDSVIVILGESVLSVQMNDILSIRYRGTLSVGTTRLSNETVNTNRLSLGVREESFLCKTPYFHSEADEKNAVDGAIASFIPGVTDRGLIAKDVIIEEKNAYCDEGELETGIIIIAPTATQTTGYIGREFATKLYNTITRSSMPRGDISFNANQMSFSTVPGNIYIVEYRCDRQKHPYKAYNLTLKEEFPALNYAKVWIDEAGMIHRLPVSILLLDKFLNQEVEIKVKDGTTLFGTFIEKNDTEIILSNTSYTKRVNIDDVLCVFYFGTVTAYQPNAGTGFINGQHWFHVNNFIDNNEIVRLEIGASVRYTFEVASKGNMCAATELKLADKAPQANALKEGYITKYISSSVGESYGFVASPEQLENCLQKNGRGKYFRQSEIVNPDAFNINTRKYYYSITYSDGENNSASNIKILKEFSRNSAPKPAPLKTYKKEIAISDIVKPDDAAAGEGYEYGLIGSFQPYKAIINYQFYNKHYPSDCLYDDSSKVIFTPKEATIINHCSSIDTYEYAYLVRYVKGTDSDQETGRQTIDYAHPVEILYSFLKANYASIILDGGQIIAEGVADIQLVPPSPSPVSIPVDVPELIRGESIYFRNSDGNAHYGIFTGETDSEYLLADGTAVNKTSVSQFYRFGVITDLNLKNGTANINNLFDFSLRNAEPKMVSILRNQKNLVRLHVMYTYSDGNITEVCRISKECQSCILWDAGVVTDLDKKARSIIIDSSATHYLSVMSDGVNPYVNDGTILNRAVFVKRVSHPYMNIGAAEPDLTDMAIDVRCREEGLKIQYDEGKDVYSGYRSATIAFPVFGAARFLHDRIGETVLVSFRISSDKTGLEGYIEEYEDEPDENTAVSEEENSLGIRKESLSGLLLYKEDTEQFAVGKSDGGLPDKSQVQRVVDTMISKSKRLAAVKVAMKYPEFDVLPNMDNLLRSEMLSRCAAIVMDANSCYGEQAFYLSTALKYSKYTSTRNVASSGKYSNIEFLLMLFSQDFETGQPFSAFNQTEKSASRIILNALFSRNCSQIGELVSHIALLDRTQLSVICPLIKNNLQLSDEIKTYTKEIDETLSGQDISEVISAVREIYLYDKQRFTDRAFALIGADNICEELKKLINSMESRFLRLICRDDRLRFERLLKICTDVPDYINKPGFAQQEQILQNAYREVCLLEDEILTHPCRESVEILMSSGQFDAASNVLVSVKNQIFSLLNSLYNDASQPRIYCTVNATPVLPGVNSFWLIIKNGSEKENLQTAENLRVELESFKNGFIPGKVSLPQSRISCGEELYVEVEFELSDEITDALEFGWTAYYECATEFSSDRNIKKSEFSQESEEPLQLQLDTSLAVAKNYDADNLYTEPAHGEPLKSRKMFFGRDREKREILDCIRTNTGEKQFIPGRAVIIHGQKKSGKTSLVFQIKNEIQEDPVLSDKAILVDFGSILSDVGGVEMLYCFKRQFYSMIMTRFEDEIICNHQDVAEAMKDAGLKIPDLFSEEASEIWAGIFDKFFRDFSRLDKGNHQIILVMDEFTTLCVAIMEEIHAHPDKALYLNDIPNFIKTFSQYGFIQIIIGHESMMRALDRLGVWNHTAEFAKTIEISVLDEDASKRLIKEPMEISFGYDVYKSDLGDRAVDRLLDLSGCHPAYLMKLCNEMCEYYKNKDKCPRTQLVLSDVDTVVREYTGTLLLTAFENLTAEDGDAINEPEERDNYRYLKCTALLSFASYDKRTADSGEITRELSRTFGYSSEQIEKTRNILEARRVISITNGGRVKINTGLFLEYIRQKEGLR